MADDDRSRDGVSMRGSIAWMARNRVAANLLMTVLIVGGLIWARTVKQEVFPEVLLDLVIVSVPYPGAGPDEVEQGVVLAVEEAIRGVDGVEEIRSTSSEGLGTVTAELLRTTDRQQALNDVKNAVDRITSFPEEAEEPIISLPTNRREVVSVILYGDLGERRLRRLSESARRELLRDPRITQVEVEGLPAPEISIEVPQENLRRYDLTPGAIARAVAEASVELGGGGVETPKGEVLLRTVERRDFGHELENVVVLSRPNGTAVTVGELGTVVDGFRDVEREAYFDGERAVQLRVFRVGDQTPIEVSEAVAEYVEERRAELPEGVGIATWNDQSEIYDDRIGLLLENAQLGLVLVLAILGLFLAPRLAFWVTLGIPITFLGVFLVMPAFDVSINMISLFAFLLVLGIVVDDAIVVGEAVHKRQSEGMEPLPGAVAGAREVARPVVFAVLTTMLAFVPLLVVPGVVGEFFAQIPLIVLPILFLSLVESLYILPAHLSHGAPPPDERGSGVLGRLRGFQARFSDAFESFVDRRYRPFAGRVIEHRYLTLACALALLIVAGGFVAGGRIPFHFLPKIEGELVSASAELPFGAPVERTREVMDRLVTEAQGVLEELGDGEENGGGSRGIFAEIGSLGAGQEDPTGSAGVSRSASHLASVSVYLVPAGERSFSSSDFTRRWREAVGEVVGVDRLAFSYSAGPPSGAKVAIELAHEDTATLERAAADLAETLRNYQGVFDVDDGFQRGKPQLDLTLRPEARTLGVTEADLARQLRGAYFGAEAVRQQRGRDELRVYVRRPESERTSLADVENLVVLTPRGGEIPLHQAAYVDRGRSYTAIHRQNGRRVVEVTADVDPAVTSGGRVTSNLEAEVLPEMLAEVDGLGYELAGEQQERAEALSSMGRGMLVALLAMFALMAIAFRSYAQPVLILLAIPFGVLGALAGHLLMGFDLSIISLFGIVALAGVVVNDSLVYVAAVNDYRRDGRGVREALVAGGVRRFRPIVLTSLTTFFGLAPMIFETSLQARFLIPMAISLGFGVLFVGLIALVIVPAGYMVLEDLGRAVGSVREALPVVRDADPRG